MQNGEAVASINGRLYVSILTRGIAELPVEKVMSVLADGVDGGNVVFGSCDGIHDDDAVGTIDG